MYERLRQILTAHNCYALVQIIMALRKTTPPSLKLSAQKLKSGLVYLMIIMSTMLCVLCWVDYKTRYSFTQNIDKCCGTCRLALKSLYRLEGHGIRELSESVQNLRPGRIFLEGPSFLTTRHLVQPGYFLQSGGARKKVYCLGRGDFFTLHTMTKQGSKHLFLHFQEVLAHVFRVKPEMPNKYCMLARLLGRRNLGATTTFIKHISNQHFY